MGENQISPSNYGDSPRKWNGGRDTYPEYRSPPSLVDMQTQVDGSDGEDDIIASPIATSSNAAAAHPVPFISGNTRPFSLQNMLSNGPYPNGKAVSPGASRHKPRGDPVSLGLISLEMAQSLFDL